ncbi:MAG TPA: delta-60 repeat domain-containing protein [Terrimicrobiaceae bacterium]
MKRFLLVLALSAGASYPQDEVALSSAFGSGEGVNGEVLAAVIQPDGKIVIGGRFSAVNGIVRNNIARLNDDGTLDRTFADQSAQGVNGQVNALAIQPQGGIIVGGTFTQAGQVETLNLARYAADGSVDQSFGGADASEPGANGSVYALAAQPDGKIVVGGSFDAVFGQPRRGIARLNADGTPDSPVTAENGLSGTVRTVALGSDASFVAAGQFTLSSQSSRNLLKVPER